MLSYVSHFCVAFLVLQELIFIAWCRRRERQAEDMRASQVELASFDMLSGKGVVGLGLGDFRLELHQLRNHIHIGASQNREPWQPLRDDSGNPETQTELCWRDSQER